MKDTPTTHGIDADALEAVRNHVARLAGTDIDQLDEAETIDLIRGNERAIRNLEGQSVFLSARLSFLGGLSGEDVFSTAGRLSTSGGRRVQRRGELTAHLPNVVAGFASGSIPAENLDRIVTVRHRLRHNSQWQSTFDSKQSSLVRKASRLNPTAFSRYLAGLERSLSDDGETETKDQQNLNTVKSWTDAHGRFRLSGNFDALTGEQISTALQAEARSLAKRSEDAGETIHHDALLDAQAFVSLIDSGNGAKGRPSVNIVVDAETLAGGPHDGSVARTRNGVDVPATLIERLLCDATVTFTYLDRMGQPLAVGRKSRTVTDAQKDALSVLYHSCAVCDVEFSRCEIHHIQYWEHGGLTDLGNLIPLCHTHHSRVHHDNWSIRLDEHRTMYWIRPDQTIFATIPLPSTPLAEKRAEHRRRKARRLCAS